MEWQPIETCPRDDLREFLIAWTDQAQPIMGFWNKTRGYVDWFDSLDPKADQPTHWMPLPKPPEPTNG